MPEQKSRSDPSVLAPAATGATGFIQRHGGDPDRVFGWAGIRPGCTDDPTLGLSLSAYCRLFEEAAHQTRNDNLGLWFGNQFRPKDLGMLGYAAVSSPTLRVALNNLVDLFHYHQQGSAMQLLAADGLLRLEYQITDGRIVQRRQDAELSLGMFLNIFRESHGAYWGPEEVHFEHPKPLAWHEHEKAFNAPVYFNQPTNALVFRDRDLDREMPNRDIRLLAILRTSLASLGCMAGSTVNLTDLVRNLLRRRLPDGYPSVEEVAEQCGTSVSALQRHLTREGLTYRDLVEDTRRELSLMYLNQVHLAFSEIAFLLGYSELSAFSRAFRRWFGVSPRRYRDRLFRS